MNGWKIKLIRLDKNNLSIRNEKFMKRILVDMSATIIHHGHIRLLKKASKFGKVIVALTTDREIKKSKGYIKRK